jgi:hypothetical protein
MRRIVRHLFATCLVLGLVHAVAAQEDAAGILRRSIQAHGGADKLAKLNAARAKSKGMIEMDGTLVPFTTETTAQLPGQLKTVMQFNLQGVGISATQVLNGEQGWLLVMGQTQPITGPMLAELKESLHASRIQSLTPLLNDRSFTLTPLKESKVQGRAAVGVKVAAPGHKDVMLYFDRETGLLLKSERKALDGRLNEVQMETLYSDYKSIEGLQSPMKVLILHDGRKALEGQVTEMRFFEKLDNREFEKP